MGKECKLGMISVDLYKIQGVNFTLYLPENNFLGKPVKDVPNELITNTIHRLKKNINTTSSSEINECLLWIYEDIIIQRRKDRIKHIKEKICST